MFGKILASKFARNNASETVSPKIAAEKTKNSKIKKGLVGDLIVIVKKPDQHQLLYG